MGKKSRAKKERRKFDAITDGMQDLAAVDGPQYDTAGWPAGANGEALARAIAEYWLDQLDAKGWDQPNTFIQVSRPDATVADFAAQGVDVSALGESLASDSAMNPDDLALAGLSSMQATTSPLHPIVKLWGDTAPPHVNALGVALEVWVGSERSLLTPSADPERKELRVIKILTRSGLYMQASRMRNENTINWEKPIPDRIGVVMHQVLRVPIPEMWPRVSLQRFLGIATAGFTTKLGQRVRAEFGKKELDADWSKLAVFQIAMDSLWRISDRGRKLSVVDARALRSAVDDDDETWSDAAALTALIDVVRRGIASMTWLDFIGAKDQEIRQGVEEGDFVPYHEPIDWADVDTIDAFVALSDLESAELLLEDLPRSARKGALEMLGILELT